MNEALVRCVDGKIHLLCALPAKWHTGELRGLKTPGGHVINLKWRNGIPENVIIKLGYSRKAVVYYNGNEYTVEGEVGEEREVKF